MTRDESLYKNADTFRPERYQEENPEADPMSFVFGFGRRCVTHANCYACHVVSKYMMRICRTCIGVHFADATLYIAIAYILSTFDISKSKDESDREIEPNITFTEGIIK